VSAALPASPLHVTAPEGARWRVLDVRFVPPLCWSALALLATAPGAAAQGGARASAGTGTAAVERQILQAERQYLDARVRNDTAAIGRLLAPEYPSVGSSGVVIDRARAMTPPLDQTPFGVRFTALDIDSTRVRVYREVATLTGRRMCTVESGPPTSAARFTYVYMRRQGRWQISPPGSPLLPCAHPHPPPRSSPLRRSTRDATLQRQLRSAEWWDRRPVASLIPGYAPGERQGA
jgi:hypothetical protein